VNFLISFEAKEIGPFCVSYCPFPEYML